MHTVGIVGINGNLGRPTTQLLVKAAEQDKIHLIVFHREGKAGDFKSGKNVELRVIDLDGPTQKIEEAVKGVNIFVSTVGVAGLASEGAAMEALSRSPDFVTFMPAVYSTTWSKQDFQDPVLGKVISSLPFYSKAKELGIGATKVYTGIFEFTFFEQGFLYASLKDNSIYANEKMLKNPLPITTMDHLAQVIARVVTTNSPEAIKGKEYSAISFWASGAEIRDLYTKLHGGKSTKVNEWTKAEREVRRNDSKDFTGSVRVGYVDKWENSTWEYETGGKILDKGYEGPGLEDVAKRFL